jgi:hypothetical protein
VGSPYLYGPSSQRTDCENRGARSYFLNCRSETSRSVARAKPPIQAVRAVDTSLLKGPPALPRSVCRRAISSFTSNLRRFNSTSCRWSTEGCARDSTISRSSARWRLSSSARCTVLHISGGLLSQIVGGSLVGRSGDPTRNLPRYPPVTGVLGYR